MTEKDTRSFETIVAEAGSIKDGANPVAQALYLSAWATGLGPGGQL